ncbi:MAG: arsenate reductase ArsC [Armatimonadetes bacterium]|nr:arsenate reductase ArsC [Armatimonadota bacterium]MDE2207950.1 arsenate reductase ArsC [Armatimonadota bacterium]
MPVKTVLFVCVHNAGRSQMAEAFLNRMAREGSLPVQAVSAGVEAGASINPVVREVMAELGYMMEGQAPKMLTPEIAAGAYRIITMGCGVDASSCPARILVSEDWGLADPAGQPLEAVRLVRDEILRRVGCLLEDLARP